MTELSKQERGLLLELQADARWASILKKLRMDYPAPWKPGADYETWIFESGKYRANAQVISILSQE